ncbi:MAG: hypothetical protein IKR39_12195 [Lachnospiraceae bacterium]|nr:hypothetical protein [Lachnospiraceae bacterium]
MLGKLIKYDLKALCRYVLPLFAVLIGSSIALRICLEIFGFEGAGNNVFVSIIVFVVAFVYVISLLGCGFAVYIIISINYYKSLMSDRGYFYLTLPVTHDMHLVSKLLSGALVIVLAAVAFILSFLPLFVGNIALPDILKFVGDIWDLIRTYLLDKNGVLIIILTVLVALFGTQIVIYFCITVGQLIPRHRILGAFLALIGHTILSRTIAAIFTATGFKSLGNLYTIDIMAATFSDIILATISYYLIIYAIEYVVTRLVLKYKLNIE